MTYNNLMTVCTLPGILIGSGSSITNVTDSFTGTGTQSVSGRGSTNNAIFVTHYLKCNGGYIVSSGAKPYFDFANATYTGNVPSTCRVSFIAMPDNMMGSL